MRQLSLIAMLILLTSCEDFLDQNPNDGLVRSEYWKNKEEVLYAVGAAYVKLADLDYTLFIHGEVRGDMVARATSTPQEIRFMMESKILSTNSNAKWDKFYSVINICNHIIKLAPGVQAKDPTFSDYLLQQYISEATFLRSLSYFYLVRIFNDVPFVLEPSETDNSEFFAPLTSADEILSTIKSELINIRQKTPTVYATIEESKSRATSAAVNSLLADICLWNEEYAECIQYIEAVEASGLFFMLPGEEWFRNFDPGASLENIFEIYYDDANSQPNSLYDNLYSTSKYIASNYALEVLSEDPTISNEEFRGAGSIRTGTEKIWKYAGSLNGSIRTSSERKSANLVIYRLADLYLMKAEAYSQSASPDYTKALEYINLVRDRVGQPELFLTSNAQVFEDAILEERAKELAFEGKRWFDLLRMGKRNNYSRKDKLIEILVQNVTSTQRLVQMAKLSNPLGWFMPIHEDEIKRNVNISQNPYYDDEN